MITFTAYNIATPPIDENRVKRWITRVAAEYGCMVSKVNYLFCNDEHILAINRQFLNHDYYTDIITFDYSHLPVLAGDIIISLETVNSNAQLLGKTYDSELHRVIIHGILHLTGQGDKSPETEAIMHHKEDLALELLKNI
ncbi:MAG TPA: rRNA maturation RNase YbeY [Bacteroidales bacterium]|nr:rRNA maturation RNase YbeY [Bacteroidales bacterium]